MLTNTVTH